MGQTFRIQPAAPEPGGAPPGVVATWFGVEVPHGPHLTPQMIEALQDGSFAATEARMALAVITQSDRVLHLGAGSGALAAAIARNCRPASLVSFERDALLVAQARTLHRHNGLEDRITLHCGAVLAEPGASDALGCATSRAARTGDGSVTVHDRLRRAYLHNVVVLDIDGAERAFLRHANLSGVRLVLVVLHPGIYGRDGIRDCRRALGRAGYERDLGLSQSGSGAEVDVFRRVRA